MAKLIKRASVTIPKPLPQRSEEESSGTILCKGAESDTDPKVEVSEPLLGHCKNHPKVAAYNWPTHLCFFCYNTEVKGLEFDYEKKQWVKPAKKEK